MGEAEKSYTASKNKKWIIVAIGAMFGVVLGYVLPTIYSALQSSKYDRSSMENVMDELLGVHAFNKMMSHELVIASYAYNEQEPRFFSKWFNYREKAHYNVKVGQATGASASAPVFFDPQEIENGYGIIEKMLDGAVICNNPAYYAY